MQWDVGNRSNDELRVDSEDKKYVIVQTLGAVAQLGERLNGIQEVVGSIPISSTK